ncbi:DnaJ-domain-containing protein [Coccomyxa subellipsoidea C-169]|uniref:DnaJ-domain-containing protein n=1 Tax=Coccomyxa subellipsoidea (strain C-169) TaxID=574566 RepID=I0YM80_COCSC|nr:DnaJ-domain-containing protein [Coccomyxa subellipsoidea C-169]EIE19499.1 DnaJ-domain-containing protein [Coccomyxa subellipsoidea C-169]|eukprot:XP_005644043.1 DnaJ-domain-containing protein [Coccomyxa subellipsoidea C-169]
MSVAQRAAKLETEPNHYAVLGVPSTATTADIKQAFRQLALKYHPDKASTPGQKAASDKLFRLVSSAHTVLADKDQRRMFDLTLLRRQINARGRHVI